jgi:hypothetical protein
MLPRCDRSCGAPASTVRTRRLSRATPRRVTRTRRCMGFESVLASPDLVDNGPQGDERSRGRCWATGSGHDRLIRAATHAVRVVAVHGELGQVVHRHRCERLWPSRITSDRPTQARPTTDPISPALISPTPTAPSNGGGSIAPATATPPVSESAPAPGRVTHSWRCGKFANRPWNERILGFCTTPSRISMAFRMVWSWSQAGGPPITVRRYGIRASLMPHVALFHR